MAPKQSALENDGSQELRLQIAALPFRRRKALEVMLVSSLESRRWVIPKGWPMKGLEDHEAAAREAFEEAGLVGDISPAATGAFHYFKRRKHGAAWLCRVSVYPMQVKEQRRNWPEKAQRKTKWFTLEQAAMAVSDPELAELLLAWAAGIRVDPDEGPSNLHKILQRQHIGR